MPTYKNNRPSALILQRFVGGSLEDRVIAPGEIFTADESEVPISWLRTPVTEADFDGLRPKGASMRPIVEKVGDEREATELVPAG